MSKWAQLSTFGVEKIVERFDMSRDSEKKDEKRQEMKNGKWKGTKMTKNAKI